MQQAQIHVLVVEDDVVNRDVVCQMLGHVGHRVSAVDSGQAALAAVRQAVHDLVVMDCRMLDMDGLETTRRLRAGEAGAHGVTLPVIALTAQGFAADREACLAAGMNEFLTKPVVMDSLVAAIARWARRPMGSVAPAAPARLPEVAQMPGPAVFDPDILSALPMVADGSQPAYAKVVLDMYFKSLPGLLHAIRQGAASGDAFAVQHAAHTLKSSSAAVGALALATTASDVELHLRAGLSEVAHLPALFFREYNRLCTHLGRQADPTLESADQPC